MGYYLIIFCSKKIGQNWADCFEHHDKLIATFLQERRLVLDTLVDEEEMFE